MKILLTGSSGLIGSIVAGQLREGGDWVRGFDLRPGGVPLDDFAQGDLATPAAIEAALEGVEAVAHLGALMSWHPRDEAAMFETNVRGTFNLARAAAARGIGRFVFASSGEVYPELDPQFLPIDETHPTRPASAYGMTKLLGEEIVRSFGRRGLKFSILRFAHTQAASELLDPNSFFSGPRFYVNAKLRQLRGLPDSPNVAKSIAALEAVATPEEQHYIGCDPSGAPYRMCMCDARDLARGVGLGLHHPAADGETFNIGPARGFAFYEAVPYLAGKTGLPVRRVSLFTASYRYETSIGKASRMLGYAPVFDFYGMVDDAAARR